jgi:gluconate kinase
MAVLLLAGPMGVGKSSVAEQLARSQDSEVVSARRLLIEMAGADEDRHALQRAGQRLDQRTRGRWLLEALASYVGDGSAGLLVVDAVRTLRQTEPVLTTLTDARLVYLDADEETRRIRFALSARHDPVKRGTDFARSNVHETERNVRQLKPLAHLVVETDSLSCAETVEIVRDFVEAEA